MIDRWKRVRTFNVVHKLREQRALSIQTELQYVFLYRAFIDYLLGLNDKARLSDLIDLI